MDGLTLLDQGSDHDRSRSLYQFCKFCKRILRVVSILFTDADQNYFLFDLFIFIGFRHYLVSKNVLSLWASSSDGNCSR